MLFEDYKIFIVSPILNVKGTNTTFAIPLQAKIWATQARAQKNFHPIPNSHKKVF